MGGDRVAVIVCCGDRPVTPDVLGELAGGLLADHKAEVKDTHFGPGYRGRYDYWLCSDWLMPDPVLDLLPTAPRAEHRPCPRCGGTGLTTAPPRTQCPVCGGRPWRDQWDFGVGHPVEWVREAVAGGRTHRLPHYVLPPDGRLYPYWWFERALAEFPACWVVPVTAGP